MFLQSIIINMRQQSFVRLIQLIENNTQRIVLRCDDAISTRRYSYLHKLTAVTDIMMLKPTYLKLVRSMLALSLTALATISFAHECDCESEHESTTELIMTDAAVSVEEAATKVATAAEAETIEEDVVAEAEVVVEEAETILEETDTVIAEAEEEQALPIYTVQILAYRNKKRAEARARVVPKFFGKAEVVVEKSNKPNHPKVYTIIAGRFEGYTPAKEASDKLCEPIYLNGCFVRRMDQVDENRYIEPEKTEEASE